MEFFILCDTKQTAFHLNPFFLDFFFSRAIAPPEIMLFLKKKQFKLVYYKVGHKIQAEKKRREQEFL